MKLLGLALVSHTSVFPPESMYLSARGPSSTRGNGFGKACLPASALAAGAVEQLPA